MNLPSGSARLLRTLSALAVLTACGGSDSGSPTTPVNDTSNLPARVVVSPTADTLRWITATRQLTASVLNATGLALSTTVAWSSSSTAVATVSSTGLVTAAGVGTTTVTAQAGSVAGTATIVVRQTPASITKVSGDNQAAVAGSLVGAPLVVEVRDQGGATVAGARLTWSVTQGNGGLETSSPETDGSGRGQATWRLGAVPGGNAVQVSGEGLSAVTFVAQGNRPPVATVEVSPPADSLFPGDTTRFAATARDQAGNALGDVTFAWTSTDTAVAVVDATGRATARSPGTALVVASAESRADTATLVVLDPGAQPPVVIVGVAPSVLVEGASAVITGTGFSAAASVTLGGRTAAVTAATATTLSITVPTEDCRPPRAAALSVTVGSRSDTRQVGVIPRPQNELAMGVNTYRYTFAGNGCLHLPAGAEFLVGVVSTSSAPSSLTPVRLTSTPGDASVASAAAASAPVASASTVAASRVPPAPWGEGVAAEAGPWRAPLLLPGPRQAPAGTGFRPLPRHDDAAMMERSRALARELGPARWPAGPQAAAPRAVAAGDTLSLFVSPDGVCSATDQVRAVVRLVGANAIWLEDVANPTAGFTTQELSDLDAFYADHTRPVLSSYYGELSDIDGNSRVLVLMTRKVNEVDGVLGWVWGGDLYPTAQCAASNHAEIYYGVVPDPQGVAGDARTKDEVLDLYPALLTHEITHIVQTGGQVLGGAGSKTTWEDEGGATLAEQLVAYRLFGHGSGQELGLVQYNAGQDWYWAWLGDLLGFFGRDTGTPGGRVASAPEQCSWIGRTEEGNSGPCSFRAVYGVPSMVLRFALDRWGGTYPGGETALMRRLTQSSFSGYASLTDVSGWRIEQILAEFYTALWADGRVYNAFGMTSWNLHEIFNGFSASSRLSPYATSLSAYQLDASVRAGSSLYLHWTPSGTPAPTSLKVTAPGSGSTPGVVSVWALRVR